MSGKFRWTVCGLLFLATTINYLDRQVLSLLAPELSTQFGWSNSDYANITATFQLVYAVAMLFVGGFIDAIGTKRAFAMAVALWSVGAAMHAWSVPIGSTLAALGFGLPASVLGFMVSRATLAVGEAGNFPAAIKATAEYFPKHERSLATGIFNSGANVGAILAPATVPFIAAAWGWQMAFIAVGALGCVWIALWAVFYDTPSKQSRLSADELAYITKGDVAEPSKSESPSADDSKPVSWIGLLKYPQSWAFIIGKFMTDGVWWFYLFWLPKYLANQYGMSTAQLALPLATLYSMTMFGSIGGGWFPAYFMKRGFEAYDGRMRAMFVIALFPLSVLLAQPFGELGYWVPIALIGVGASAHQAWSANLFTTVSDMFPKRYIATVVGVGGMAGGVGGVALSKLGGWIFDAYGASGQGPTGYMIMFSLCAVAYILAWFVMKALVPHYKRVVLP